MSKYSTDFICFFSWYSGIFGRLDEVCVRRVKCVVYSCFSYSLVEQSATLLKRKVEYQMRCSVAQRLRRARLCQPS